MTTGGTGIPRLQELSYLEIAAVAVLEEVPFEGIRRRLVDHMVAISQASGGTGNIASLQTAESNPKRYVRNVSEALKELMRLGLLHKAVLPSSAATANLYTSTRFVLTDLGVAWAELLGQDRRVAYDQLINRLLLAHPQFGGFLRVVSDGLTVPLMRWAEQPEPRSRRRYVELTAERVADATAAYACGWSDTAQGVARAIDTYVGVIEQRAEGKREAGKNVRPFARNQDFVNTCEEALVKLAFTNTGAPIDYISHEILRRWTRFLGLANFSYHVPESPQGLRLWPTADWERIDAPFRVARRAGPDWRDRVLTRLPAAYDLVRKEDAAGSLWVPIYKVRAAVCFQLQLQDEEFDRALIDMGRGERGGNLTYRPNLDPAQYGSVPPSERPLIVPTRDGRRTYYSISLVPRRISPPITERSTS